jgi:hypothetical protein
MLPQVGVTSVDPEWEEAVVKESQKGYEAPALVVLGPVQDLTRGSTGTISDGPFHSLVANSR